MRFFLTLSYSGTRYNGWQTQPNAPSVQSTLEQALAILLRQNTSVTGCGRTDTGVHARYYVAHFDSEYQLPSSFLKSLNGLLPPDIAVYACREVPAEAHARYDARERSYAYYMALRKDPFATTTSWFFPKNHKLDIGVMQQTAGLLVEYNAFFPFCKTDSGAEGYQCVLKSAAWEHHPNEYRLIFRITANRFLRGMVRLIVGACVNTGLGKISLQDVRTALDEQKPLKKSLSVPPQGLFLTDVRYPPELFQP
jgi:tRNA pseudouridine38-40 synthase